MAAVHEAVRVSDGRRVALKLLNPDLAANPAARARFLNEARLSAGLRDSHVVAVVDSGEADDQVYLAMELLEGEDLAGRIRREGALPVAEAAEILIPVCEAVAMAHRRGITHRDLKPSNIFLAVRDDRIEPVVLDFGIAQQTDQSLPADGAAAGRALVGTPMYLAPELVADPQAASPASDQYALGVILYEVLTGEPPYAADDLPELLALIAAGEPRPPRARRAELSLDLDAVVQRAMSRVPDERFPSVSDLGRALAPFAPADRAVSGRRRALSSPAIEVEAAVPSPFQKTLSPEAHPDSGGWFVAPPLPQAPPLAVASAAEPVRVVVAPAASAEPDPVLPPLASTAVVPSRSRAVLADEDLALPAPATSGRRRVVLVSALALGALAVLVLARSARHPRPEAPAVVEAPAPPPAPAVQPPPAPVAAAAEPARAPESPPPAAAEPAPAGTPEPAQAAAEPTAAPERPRAPGRQPAAEPAAEPARAPVRQAAAEPAAAPPEHVAKPRVRPRPAADVRMHNGVPLLD